MIGMLRNENIKLILVYPPPTNSSRTYLRYFYGLKNENSWRKGPLHGADFDGTASNLRSEAKQVHILLYNRITEAQRTLLLKAKPDGATDGSYAQWITGKKSLIANGSILRTHPTFVNSTVQTYGLLLLQLQQQL